MQATSHAFKQNAHEALGDATLKRALSNMKPGFQGRRAAAVARLPEWEQLRERG
jgi:L-lactate dehydrogenase complex protein LldF